MPSKQDLSFISLILTNVLFGVYFIYIDGEIGTLLWVYWSQSVIIGIIDFFRIWTQKNFSVDGLKINGRQAEKTNSDKKFVSFFFLFHYGFFHVGYFAFLIALVPSNLNFGLILGPILFGANHLFSFLLNHEEESLVEKNIGKLMLYPYARIIPMHFIILFGGLFILSKNQPIFIIILFLSLKIIADAIMHIVEHKILRRRVSNSSSDIVH